MEADKASKKPQGEQGWAGLRFDGPAPSLKTHVWQVLVGHYILYDIYIYIYIYIIYRSEGFPLTGLFHPWAQWDRGLDILENYSRRAAAVAVALWLVGW